MSDPIAIKLGGYVSGGGGTLPILGVAEPQITSNADLTLSLAQSDPFLLDITSDGTSTAQRKVIVPLIRGKSWFVVNNTSEGFPIQVIGSSGNGVVIAPGGCAMVGTDGTNVYAAGSGGGISSSAPLTVTYRPGGVASGLTFTSWSSLVSYVSAAITAGYDGVVVYQFDDSLGSVSVSGNVPGTCMQWVGIGSGYSGTTNATITIQSGTVFSAFAGFVGCCNLELNHATIVNKSNSLATIAGASHSLSIVMNEFVTWLNQSTSTAAFEITTGAQCAVYLLNNTSVQANPHPPMITVDTGHSSTLAVVANTNCTIGEDAFSGGNTGAITVGLFGNCTLVAQPNYGATYAVTATSDCTVGSLPTGGTVTFKSLSSQTVYSPALPNNWTNAPISAGVAPSADNVALDLLAATVHGLSSSNGITQLTGDGTATGPGNVALTVVRVNGTTVPAGGSLTAGNSLYASGASSATWSALNLAGGSAWVTGLLPVANIAKGTAGQVFVTNAGATAAAWVSFTGDVTVTGAGVTTVGAIGGNAWPASGTGYLQWNGSTLSWAAGTGGSGITALTGDVTASGSGSVAAAIQTLKGPAGSGGAILLSDGTNGLTLEMLSSLQSTPPLLQIQGATGYVSPAGVGGAGGAVSYIGANGGTATGSNHVGGAGGAVFVGAGNAGNSTGTAANSSGGNLYLFTGAPGSGGSGGSGNVGTFTVALSGQFSTPSISLSDSTADYFAIGAAPASTAQSGLIRFPAQNGTQCVAIRNHANTADLTLLDGQYSSTAHTHNWTIGSGFDNGQIDASTSVTISSANVGWFVNNTSTGASFLVQDNLPQGIPVTQNQQDNTYRGVVTATSNQQLLVFPTTSGKSGNVRLTVVYKATVAPSGGALQDTSSFVWDLTYKNIGGTVSLVGSPTVVSSANDTHAPTSVGIAASGSNLVINASVSSGTFDTQAKAVVFEN